MKRGAPTRHRIEAICEVLDHPEKAIPAIHITGTNGKTSTARVATALLSGLGLNVGTYTSPHLETIRERVAWNGDPISEDAFGGVYDHIRPYVDVIEARLGEQLTYFELLTAMYFLWAAEAPVDVSVIEVGLGGLWDATNVVDAGVSVITNIGHDHTEILGNDKRDIAREKAGIIKPGGVTVTAERHPDILEIFEETANSNDATLLRIDRDFGVIENKIAVGGRYLSVTTTGAEYEGLFLPLHGSHQGVNAATALQAVVSFLPAQQLSEEVVSSGLATVSAPGRLETFRVANIEAPVVIDVAHNPEGASALVTALLETFAFDRAIIVIGVLNDKDPLGIFTELTRIPAHLLLTQAKSGRAMPIDELSSVAATMGLDNETVPDVADAVDRALAMARTGDLVCIAGSHYVAGEARDHLETLI
ncbi:MAG TPA: folylpolyglutamate synthase/dihydrofolate synthase family protein [Actinomycetota bacterium]|nr:folylpolyglutamate synthase/dihydrofolate synthase family protein [Actinomycetota bacterium]